MPTISTLTVDVQARTSRFSSGIKTAVAGLAALAAGAAYAFKQFEESEQVAKQTNAVLKSTGDVANVTAKHVADLAAALSKKAGIDDEAIQTGENMILTFKNISNEVGKGNDIFDQTTKAVLDMSVAMGQDMKSSAIQVGKALNDPINGLTALRRVGVTFSDSQVKLIEHLQQTGDLMGAQKIILQELTAEFGGSAAAQATASGKMSVALENLAESVGAVLAPAITKLAGWITTLAEKFTNLDPHIQTLITSAAGAAAVVIVLSKAFGALTPAVHATTVAFSTLAAHPIVAALLVLAATVALVTTKWDSLNGALKAVLVVFSPLGTGIGLIIRYAEQLWKSTEGLRDALVAVWRAIGGTVLGVINAIIGNIERLIGWIKTAIDWLGKLGRSNPFTPGGGGEGPAPPFNVPLLQHGGIVTRPTLAMVGEHGPEAVVPLGSGLGGITVIINGDVTGEEIIRKVEQGLTAKLNRSGALFNGSVTR